MRPNPQFLIRVTDLRFHALNRVVNEKDLQ